MLVAMATMTVSVPGVPLVFFQVMIMLVLMLAMLVLIMVMAMLIVVMVVVVLIVVMIMLVIKVSTMLLHINPPDAKHCTLTQYTRSSSPATRPAAFFHDTISLPRASSLKR